MTAGLSYGGGRVSNANPDSDAQLDQQNVVKSGHGRLRIRTVGELPVGDDSGPVSGGGLIIPATFMSALAIRENVIRLYFTAPVYFSGLLDPGDASNPQNYVVSPVAGTTGRDGNAPRPVSGVSVAVGTELASIDITLDRPMTPSPAQYQVASSGLLDGATSVPVPTATGATPALYRVLVPAVATAATPSRDVANPNSLPDLVAVSPYANPTSALGTLVYDDTGDYALDDGLVSYKKRVLRRGITRKNGFAHLPGYGVGIPTYGKKLQRAGLRSQLAQDWQTQIGLEPETASVSVTSSVDPSNPALVYFAVRATTKAGKSVNFQLPVTVGT